MKNKIKYIIVLVLMLITVLSLCACVDNNTPDPINHSYTISDPTVTQTDNGNSVNVIIIPPTTGDKTPTKYEVANSASGVGIKTVMHTNLTFSIDKQTSAVTYKVQSIYDDPTSDKCENYNGVHKSAGIYTFNVLGKTPEYGASTINIGENEAFTLESEEIKYISIEPEQLGAYDFNISATGTLGVFVAFNHPDNKIVNYQELQNAKGSFLAGLHGCYYLSLQNRESGTIDVTVSINESGELLCNTQIENAGVFERIYLIKPEYSSSYMVNAIGQYSLNAYLYDSDFTLFASNGGNNIGLSNILISGKTYYIMAKPSANMTFSISFSPLPTNLQLGSNNLNKSELTKLYEYKSQDTDVVVDLSSTGLDSIKLYDSAMIEKNDRLLLEGQQYYIGVKGTSNNFTIDLNVAISSNEGIIPSTGFAFIEFHCERTGNYIINGSDSYSWYTAEHLLNYHNYLSVNNKYYLKIKGASGSAYSVTITYDAPQLGFGTKQNIDAGYFKTTINDSGDYSFKTYSAAGVTTTFTIYDSNHTAVYSNVDASTEKVLYLNADTYYVDVVVENSTKTTIQILQIINP